MKKQTFIAIAVVSLLAIAFYLIWQNHHANQNQPETIKLAQKPKGGDFTLTSVNGPVSLHDFKGKLVLLYFGYTYCPDICPTNLSNLSIAYNRLPKPLQEQVQIIFVSVDPDRDPPKRLQQYSDFYHANILGLTGTRAEIDKVAKQYGVIYKIHKEGNDQNYSVDHSAFTYVIDPEGHWVTQLPHASTPDQFIQIIQQQLGEKTHDQ